ncbi:MAG: hypothetical protein AAFR61_08200 [Bacteroidota bacterium]
MKEKGKETLKRAIEQLPDYQAPDMSWEDIQADLETTEPVLQEAIRQLPVYSAPEGVWGRIQRQLAQPTLVRMMRSPQAWAAMLGFLLGLAGLLWWANLSEVPEVIAEKEQDAELIAAQIASYEAEEQALLACLEARQADAPEVQEARTKLQDITETRDSLIIILQAGEKKGASKRLRRMEHRRKQLVYELQKQMCQTDQPEKTPD